MLSGNAGAGGGGAGGSVALSFQGFASQLQLASNGGNGGTNPGGFGQGGGGGGGLLWLSSSGIPSNITSATVAYGTPAPTIPSEGNGEIKYNFIPKLNGFLFNSIRLAATGTQIDSVCSNIMYRTNYRYPACWRYTSIYFPMGEQYYISNNRIYCRRQEQIIFSIIHPRHCFHKQPGSEGELQITNSWSCNYGHKPACQDHSSSQYKK